MKVKKQLIRCCIFFLFWIFFCVIMSRFKISSLNVNGARDVKKRAMFFEFLKSKGIDIAFAQETHSNVDNEVDWKKEWDGNIILSHNTSLSAGVAILFSRNFLPVSIEIEDVVSGRLLKVIVKYENIKFILLNVYAPVNSSERCVFLEKLANTLLNCVSTDYLILGGDFNCTIDDLDRNHLEPHLQSRKILKRIIETYDLADVWRFKNGKMRQYSWAHCKENYITLARLDRFYCFGHHLQIFRSCTLCPVGFSDHCMIIGNVFINNLRPKSAYWHFNTVLLNDGCFKKGFCFFWKQWRLMKCQFTSIQQWWDIGKIKIQQFCNQYTYNVTREMVKSIEELETEIVDLQSFCESTGNRGHIQTLKQKKNALADLLGLRAQGALVRSRFQSVSEMDAPSKFFFSLEKKNGQNRLIHCIRSEDGKELTDPTELRKRAVDFFSTLYASEFKEDSVITEEFFKDLQKVSDQDNLILEHALTLEELQEALLSMENGKAPGIDGLSVEFYKSCWPVLAEDLLEVLNNSVARGMLPLSCRRAVLTLIPKKGDLYEIRNWRPVSLLCTDYKIFSKVLACRLRKVIDQVIHVDQSYCIPGRSIRDNITLIRDYLDVSNLLGLNFGLISIDQEKAFDRVEHQYLWNTLKAFGFSSGFIAMIKTLYCDIESVLKVNGGLSAPFNVKRGIRQGCAMSGMLYSLSIEPLLCQIRKRLQGIKLSEVSLPFQLSAYADDIIVAITKESDVFTLIKIIECFGKISSSKVNWSKSKALSVGKWTKQEPKLPDELKWSKNGFKYLGVYLGDQIEVMKNWEGFIELMEGRLKKWHWLLPRCSYRGRTLIINNLVASTLWHRLSVLEPPPGLLVKLQIIILNFFWDRLHWVPQSVLFLPKEEGGQGLIHLESRKAAFRLQFLQSFLYGDQNVLWRQVTEYFFSKVGNLGFGKTLFIVDFSKHNVKCLSSFYVSVLKSWNLMETKRVGTSTSLNWLLLEPVLQGSRLGSAWDKMAMISERLMKSGLVTLKHLLELVGSEMDDIVPLARRLEIHSLRTVSIMLATFKRMLSEDDKRLIKGWFDGRLTPDKADPFLKLCFKPQMKDLECPGPFLEQGKSEWTILDSVNGKLIYMKCVKALNKVKLIDKKDTPWRDYFKVGFDVKPVWGLLYKPPLTKNVGDLQWRILHGIIAVNAFASIINPVVSDKCPFCLLRETIFHCFVQCLRLMDLFALLRDIWGLFGESFIEQSFIFGSLYGKGKKKIGRLFNFFCGQAKLAIYLSRKFKISNEQNTDCVKLFKSMVRARVMLEYKYYLKG
uniref:Reverse transcriptase domain-containing protein n=1 Tax=Xiphophorus maculatus TaxID=8083 RepID=A0A3B5PPF5_XIPMA